MTSHRRLVFLLVVLASVVPYLPTLDDYFVQDDFGVVGLLSSKPAGYFPRWFVTPWMDNIWGYTPDEIRPFPALTYQIAAVLGAASPAANHAINIAFHAATALLVLLIGETVAGLSLGPAAFAALVFALLPMQTESVAWITGRVDSMPACFYLASFLLYARWRARSHASFYAWSVAVYFIALFTKQNAVTLPAALVLYDALVERRRIGPSIAWLVPYVPFALLTLGYFALRYSLFGEVAREGRLNAEYVGIFLQNLSIHLRRMVLGEAGLKLSDLAAATRLAIGAIVFVAVSLLADPRERSKMLRPAIFFLTVWIMLGVAPTIVAGYGSPRHMYLAAAGWALALGAALGMFWHARPRPIMKGLGVVLAAAILVGYVVQLSADVQLWGVRSTVSRRVLADIEREAMAAPPGTLILIDPPQRSWNFAAPHALRPPFTREDLPSRVSVISHSSIHCCPANVWEPYTRRTIQTWMANSARPPAIALRWNPDTGELFRLREDADPFLRTAISLILEAPDVTNLDSSILSVSKGLVTKPAR